ERMPKLALKGGAPVRTKPFHRWPHWDERERRALEAVLEAGSWGGYPSPNRFAKELGAKFAAYCGSKHGVCAANGSVTLEMAILEIAERRGLVVIEDCAHSHGARWRGRCAGSIGRFGSFSFQTSKLLTAGEGGIVTTSDDEAEMRLQSLVNCGRKEPGYDRFE